MLQGSTWSPLCTGRRCRRCWSPSGARSSSYDRLSRDEVGQMARKIGQKWVKFDDLEWIQHVTREYERHCLSQYDNMLSSICNNGSVFSSGDMKILVTAGGWGPSSSTQSWWILSAGSCRLSCSHPDHQTDTWQPHASILKWTMITNVWQRDNILVWRMTSTGTSNIDLRVYEICLSFEISLST